MQSAPQDAPDEFGDDTDMSEVATWLGHERTRQLRKLIREQARKDLHSLLQLCEQTSDPKVAQAYSAYKTSKATDLFFEKLREGRDAKSVLP